MKELVQWLNSSREWDKGVDLIQEFATDQQVRNLFAQVSPSPVYADMLFQEIRSIYYALKKRPDKPSKQPDPPPTPIPQFPSGGIAHLQQEPVLPNPVKDSEPFKDSALALQCKLEADKLYKLMMNTRAELFAQCFTVPVHGENSDEALSIRSDLAMKIMELQYEVDLAYDRYRYVIANGQLPDAPSSEFQVPTDPMDLLQTKLNLQKAINKLKRREQTAERIALIQQKSEHLNRVLHAIDQHKNR